MTAPDRIWACPGNDRGWYAGCSSYEPAMIHPDETEYLSRSHSNALVAAAYEDAAKICESELPNADWIADGLRCSIPDDAQSTLDAIKAEVRREALQEAASKAEEFKAKDMWEMRDAGHDYCAAASHVHAAILSLMEKDAND